MCIKFRARTGEIKMIDWHAVPLADQPFGCAKTGVCMDASAQFFLQRARDCNRITFNDEIKIKVRLVKQQVPDKTTDDVQIETQVVRGFTRGAYQCEDCRRQPSFQTL